MTSQFLTLSSDIYRYARAADAARSAYTVSSIDMSEEVSGRELIWKGALTDERQRCNGRWVQRDGLNQIYAVHGG